ncbi:MAG: LysR family transcriptional regulator [Granulosicoccus sp.]
MSLKLRHLDVFVALLEAGSVSKAAERLNLTQPAVSIALNNFETELGFRLFHRARGFFAPTPEAMLLHDEVMQGVRAMTHLEQRARDIRSGKRGNLSIATNGVLAFNFLPHLLASFQAENPDVSIEIKIHSSRQIASLVANHSIDIGLIDPPVPVAGLQAEVFNFECVCAMRRDDELATLKTITPQALSGRSIIGVTGDHAIDRQLDAALAQTNTVVTRSINSYYFAIARKLVAEGAGIAILDPINTKVDLHDDVIWRPFEPRIESPLAIITAKTQPLGIVALDILSRMSDALRLIES